MITFQPENELERSLMRAADPAARPRFYDALLAADIFILHHGDPLPLVDGKTLPAGAPLSLQKIEVGGQFYVPFFTSLPRLQAVLQQEPPYLQMNSRAFFAIVTGTDLILNPESPYGKRFTAAEVQSMVDGTLGQPVSTTTTQRPTQVFYGTPAKYPHELVNALSALFKTLPQVERAYLTHFYNPESGDPSHTLIAVAADGDWDALVRQIGIVAQSVPILDPALDCQHLKNPDSPDSYFSTIKPFYRRKKFGLF